MRKYMLANIEQRGKVDLRNYKDIIVAAVQEFAPGSTVVVRKDHYTVKEQLSHSQVVRVGRRICSITSDMQMTPSLWQKVKRN